MCSNWAIWELWELQDKLWLPSSPSNTRNYMLRQHTRVCVQFVMNVGMIWARAHTPYRPQQRKKQATLFFLSRHQVSNRRQGCLDHALPYLQAALGVLSYCSRSCEPAALHFLSLSPCQSDSWNAASSATLVLLLLPRQPERAQWRRQEQVWTEVLGLCVSFKKGYFLLQHRTRSRLVSFSSGKGTKNTCYCATLGLSLQLLFFRLDHWSKILRPAGKWQHHSREIQS